MMLPRLRWLLLAAVAVAVALLAWEWFRPVNRVQRAAYRLLAVMPKDAPGPDPLPTQVKVLGTCREALAEDAFAVVHMNPVPRGIRGRDEILQNLQFLRQSLDHLWLDHAVVEAEALPGDCVKVRVEVPFKARLSRQWRSQMEDHRWDYDLHARLLWTNTPSGWRIASVEVAPFRGEPLSENTGE